MGSMDITDFATNGTFYFYAGGTFGKFCHTCVLYAHSSFRPHSFLLILLLQLGRTRVTCPTKIPTQVGIPASARMMLNMRPWKLL